MWLKVKRCTVASPQLTDYNKFAFLPFEFMWTAAYLDVILRGAEESQLPEKYLDFLKGIVHNDRDAHPQLLTKLFGEINEWNSTKAIIE